jgi:hypothetical protein
MRRFVLLVVAAAGLAAGTALEAGQPPAAVARPQACVPRWRAVASPAIRDGRLSGVAALSRSDAWAVGDIAGSSVLIEHWNGSTWSRVPSPRVNGWLNEVGYAAANDVWAVGGSDETANDAGTPLVEHWNGRSWARVNVPSAVVLHALGVVSASDIWAVGSEYGTVGHKVASITHWDGRTWKQVASLRDIYLVDIIAISARDVWAVGEDKAERPLAMRWDGTRWQSFALPRTKGEEFVGVPHSVAAVSSKDVWAAGSAATELVGSEDPRLWHWSGSRWRIAAPGTGLGGIVDVVARRDGEVWTTGYDDSPHVDEGSFVRSRVGSTAWRTAGLGPGRYIDGLAVEPGGGIWTVGLDYRGQDLTSGEGVPHHVPLVEHSPC